MSKPTKLDLTYESNALAKKAAKANKSRRTKLDLMLIGLCALRKAAKQ